MDSTEHKVEGKTYTVYTWWIVNKEDEVTAKSSKGALMQTKKKHEKFFMDHDFILMDGTGYAESDDEPEQINNLDKEVKELTEWVNNHPKKE